MNIFIRLANTPCDSFLSIILKSPSGGVGTECLGWKYDGNWITSSSLGTMASMVNLEVEAVVTGGTVTGTWSMVHRRDKGDLFLGVMQMQF